MQNWFSNALNKNGTYYVLCDENVSKFSRLQGKISILWKVIKLEILIQILLGKCNLNLCHSICFFRNFLKFNRSAKQIIQLSIMPSTTS